jgi:hypothetical protein
MENRERKDIGLIVNSTIAEVIASLPVITKNVKRLGSHSKREKTRRKVRKHVPTVCCL